MGILTTDGAPLMWGTPTNNNALPYVRDHGIHQLLNIFKQYKDVEGSPFLWGEEMEHIIIRTDPKTGGTLLSLNAGPVLDKLASEPKSTANCGWRPEYGSFMVESVPAEPYTDTKQSLLSVEANMRERVNLIDEVCLPNERGALVVGFPLMGRGKFYVAPDPEDDKDTDVTYSESLFVPDICINQTHPRFANLTRNIRLRRGRKVCIQVPMFIDRFTLKRSVDHVYNIDASEQNRAITCGGCEDVGAKRRRAVAFGGESSEDEDEGKEEENDETIAARKAKAHHVSRAVSSSSDPTKKVHSSRPSGSAGADESSPPHFSSAEEEYFRHVFTPSTHYYYAQYGSHDESVRENVKQRYDACPCPVPNVMHPCVYMDCMAFGMGLSCLQVTMQLKNVNEARHVYDQMVPLCPLLLALTAATPFQKGMLCDSDIRWVTISASVDDRHPDEVPHIMKSRYDSVSVYISPFPKDLDSFNSNQVQFERKYYDQIVDHEGCDSRLAKHFAHLFIRDPLVIYGDGIHQIDDTKRTDHFENVQTTNWQTVRFKPPAFGANFGWRVEFRPMEIQPTPFENAAFSIFVSLITKAMLKYKTSYYIPMHLADTNMGTVHRRDPNTFKYHFNVNVSASLDSLTAEDAVIHQLTLDEVFNGVSNLPVLPGKPPITSFEGLVPFVKRYLKDTDAEDPKLFAYLELISRRARGELLTPAQLFRQFVVKHPDYQQDSRLTAKIGDDYLAFALHLCDTQAWEDYLPSELTGGTLKPFQGKTKI